MKLLANNPRPFGSHKITGSENDYRIKVGNFRIIYEVDDKEKLVKVMQIRHRREVYR
jgi:mRNA interferase RelE/StbE